MSPKPQARKFPLECLEIEQPPAKHYDIYGPEPCPCKLCDTWRDRARLNAIASEANLGHGRSCECLLCKTQKKAKINLLIVENIRDIWTEVSWCAWMEEWEPDWVDWLMLELADPERPRGWWSSQSSHYPMAFWYARYESWKRRKTNGR